MKGRVEDYVVGVPLRAHRREPALGDDREHRAVKSGSVQQPADTLGMREIAARVNEDHVGRRRLDERGRVGWQDPHRVQQQAEGWQNLRGRLQDAGHQQQVAHLKYLQTVAHARHHYLYKHIWDPGATSP